MSIREIAIVSSLLTVVAASRFEDGVGTVDVGGQDLFPAVLAVEPAEVDDHVDALTYCPQALRSVSHSTRPAWASRGRSWVAIAPAAPVIKIRCVTAACGRRGIEESRLEPGRVVRKGVGRGIGSGVVWVVCGKLGWRRSMSLCALLRDLGRR